MHCAAAGPQPCLRLREANRREVNRIFKKPASRTVGNRSPLDRLVGGVRKRFGFGKTGREQSERGTSAGASGVEGGADRERGHGGLA